MNLVKKDLSFKIGGLSDESRSMWVIGSTEDVDRDGDRIMSSGWNFGNFIKNPVIPWAHKYDQPPVAKAMSVKIDDRKLKLLIKFATAGEYPFADTIYRLYKGGYLNAFSVGFNPIRYAEVTRSSKIRGRDYYEQELWEVSACTVPSNPNALIAAKQKGVIGQGEYELINIEWQLGEMVEGTIRDKIEKVINARIIHHNINGMLKRRGLI